MCDNEELVEVEAPAVCPLCWGWIFEGQPRVQLVDGLVHRECWQKGEAD